MELKDAILGRRSVRKYKDTPVSDELLQEVLDMTMWAPSGVNLQPWCFVVVRSEEGHKSVLQHMGATAQRFKPVLEERFANHPEVAKETVSFLQNLGGAPVVVLVFKYTTYEGEEQNFGCEQSVAAAIQTFCLAAHAKGLGTCWMTAGHAVKEELTREFGEGKGEYMAMISLGYPDEQARAPKRKEGRYEFV